MKILVGELSKLCGVSVRTINYYESLGLLQPDYIERHTAYRYYGIEQLSNLCYIIWLKEQGFTLHEIKEILDSGFYTPDTNRLKHQLIKCKQEMDALEIRYESLSALMKSLEKRDLTSVIYLDRLPSIVVASHTFMISGYEEVCNHILEVILPEMLRLGCQIAHLHYNFVMKTGKVSSDDKFEVEYCNEILEMKTDSDIIKFKLLPEVPLAMCMKVYGAYAQLETSRNQLFKEIAERGYRVIDAPRYNFVYNVWNQKDPNKWLTIIQVPVEPEKR